MRLRRPHVLAAALLLLVVLPLALHWVLLPSDPSYEGHTLTEWVNRSLFGPGGDSVTVEATEVKVRQALVALGTNHFRLLVQRLSYDAMKSPFHKYCLHLPRFVVRSPPFIWGFNAEGDRNILADDARHVFRILGPLGAPAAPKLARIVREGSETPAKRALHALAYLGEPGLPLILDTATTKHHPLRAEAIRCLALHTNLAMVRSVLTHAQQDPDLVVRQQAQAALEGKQPY